MWPDERYLWIGSSKFSDEQCAGAVMLFCGLERPTPEIAENPHPAWDFATDTRDPRRPGMYSSFLSPTEVPTLHTDPLEIESPAVKSAKAAGLSVPHGPNPYPLLLVCLLVSVRQLLLLQVPQRGLPRSLVVSPYFAIVRVLVPIEVFTNSYLDGSRYFSCFQPPAN
jgi:hypothetical protein